MLPSPHRAPADQRTFLNGGQSSSDGPLVVSCWLTSVTNMLAVSRQYSRSVDADTLMSQKHTLPSSCLSINSTPVNQRDHSHACQSTTCLSINSTPHVPVNQQHAYESTAARLSINSTPVNQRYQSHTCQSVARLSINILKLQYCDSDRHISLPWWHYHQNCFHNMSYTYRQDVSNMTEKLV